MGLKEYFQPEVGQAVIETLSEIKFFNAYENPLFKIPKLELPSYYNMFPVGVFHTILIDGKFIAYQVGIAGPIDLTPKVRIHDSIHVFPDLKSGLDCCVIKRIKRIDENGYGETLFREYDYYLNGFSEPNKE